jgi:hypothetical protein
MQSLSIRSSYLLLGSVIFLTLAAAAVLAWLLVLAPGSVDARVGPQKAAAVSGPG